MTFYFQKQYNHSLNSKKSSDDSLPTKAMRLPEIFGLSTFPVFRHCPTFDGRKSSETKSSLFRFRLSRKAFRNYRNNQKFRHMSKIPVYFQHLPEFSNIHVIHETSQNTKSHLSRPLSVLEQF